MENKIYINRELITTTILALHCKKFKEWVFYY